MDLKEILDICSLAGMVGTMISIPIVRYFERRADKKTIEKIMSYGMTLTEEEVASFCKSMYLSE